MAIAVEHDAAGRILKRTSAQAESPIIEDAEAEEAEKAKPVSDPLEEYRSQARELQDALAKVKDLHAQTATVTQQRENVLRQRESLLDSFEDESAVAELKPCLAAFATSFNALYWILHTFLVNGTISRIASILHPSCRVIRGAYIAQVAAFGTEVVDFEQLAIRIDPMASMLDNQLPPDAIEREAERALPYAGPLLAEAAKHLENGFVPPAPFSLERWRDSLSPAAAA